MEGFEKPTEGWLKPAKSNSEHHFTPYDNRRYKSTCGRWVIFNHELRFKKLQEKPEIPCAVCAGKLKKQTQRINLTACS